MKTKTLICVTAMTLFAALVLSIPLAAQNPPGPTHYRVIDLGTLGGTSSFANTINNVGWAMGGSDHSNGNQIATLWLYGLQIPLGTINGGPGSDVAWPNKNNFGLISGITENGVHDPLNETFSCPAFNLLSGNSCVAFVWQFGQMTQLPGLGGNNSIGAGNNNRGQIVGWAEDNFHDPTCAPPAPGAVQYLQFEATFWQRDYRGEWQVKQLPPYPGDPDSAATAINDRGQIVGISGQCDIGLGFYSAIHSVLWEDGQPINLGSLGGSAWNTPQAINNHGTVIGFDNGPNDVIDGQLQFRWIAFVWTKQSGTTKIGFLPGDQMSQATDINDEGQIVGVSYVDYNFDNPRAFIYQDGAMTALNDLIGSASADWDISGTGGINDGGVIAAQANPVVNGVVNGSATHAVLLVPCDPSDAVAYGEIHKLAAPANDPKRPRRVTAGHFYLYVSR
jgi:probable HAF family extracellular repeat protein